MPTVAKLSISDVLRETWRAWRRDWRYLTLLAALVETPLIVLQIVVLVTTGISIATDDSFEVLLVSVPMFLWGILSHHFFAGALESLESAERLGHPVPRPRVLLRDLPWVRLLVADVLISAATAVGVVLFVVPGLVIGTYTAITLPLLNRERRPVTETLGRSVRLVRGNFWRVFVIGGATTIVLSAATELLTEAVEHLTHSDLGELIAHVVPTIVLMPIGALPAVIVMFNLVAIDDARRPVGSLRPLH